jgi:hypothetical protein
MKEKRTLTEISTEVERFARQLLKKSGYSIPEDKPDIQSHRANGDRPGEKGLTVDLSVVGYSYRYDGWDHCVTQGDWKRILAVQWRPDYRMLLEHMRDKGNVTLSVTELHVQGILKSVWPSSFHPGNYINKEMRRCRLPFHLGVVHTNPKWKNGYPTMIRMFHHPADKANEE